MVTIIFQIFDATPIIMSLIRVIRHSNEKLPQIIILLGFARVAVKKWKKFPQIIILLGLGRVRVKTCKKVSSNNYFTRVR